MRPIAIRQNECYAAAVLFARSEGIIPAPETSHAIAGAVREANKAKEEGKEKVIVFGLSGHGMLDLSGYDAYLSGNLEDHELSEEEIQTSTQCMDQLPKPSTANTGKW